MPLRIIKLSYKYLLLPIVTISRIIIIIGIAIATVITSAITIFMLGELYNYVHIYMFKSYEKLLEGRNFV